MAKCKCSDSCERYVSPRSQTGLAVACAGRVRRWENAEVDVALEYARKLDVRRGTLSFVVNKSDVARLAIEKRREALEDARRELEKLEREKAKRARERARARIQAKGRMDTRKKGRAGRTHERKQAGQAAA